MSLLSLTSIQFYALLLGALSIVGSIFSFNINKVKLSLLLLFTGSIGLGVFMANLDPYLVLWDEQFHALVAKNIIDNPLKPTLFKTPLLDYDYKVWAENHIWLHKQPLFLWQIALSLKLLGCTPFAVRLPSILLHAISVLMIYRIGKISYSDKVGFYGALFFACSYFSLELVAGYFGTDHNDVSFLFYVLGSFWAWFEFQQSKQKRYLILIGLLAGCAVLVKWLVGLLIYLVWFLTIGLNDKKKWTSFKSYQPLLLSAIISFVVFIPWQIYTLIKFPTEANFELEYNTRHFFEAIENHTGDVWFHFRAFKEIYGTGEAVPFIFALALLILLYKIKIKSYRYAILFAIVITYTFYTIAATKMLSFCVIVSPFIFLALASPLDVVFTFLTDKVNFKHFNIVFKTIVLVAVCVLLFEPKKIQTNHCLLQPDWNSNRQAELAQMEFIKKLTHKFGDQHYVIFNAAVRYRGQIAVMFFTNYIAYDIIPTENQIKQVTQKKYKVAIWDNGDLPAYITNNASIIKIKL
jgi:hypothetical protein